jgi:hypothetical protein
MLPMQQQTAEQMDVMLGYDKCWPIPSTPGKVLTTVSPKVPHLYAVSQDVVDRFSG